MDRNKEKCKPEQNFFYRVAYRDGVYWRVKDFYLLTKTIASNGLFTDDSFKIPHGMHYWYSLEGKLEKKGRYIDGLKEGVWKTYSDSGKLIDSSLFLKGLPWKFAYRWFTDGKISFKGVYDDSGKGNGYETEYYENGGISFFGKYAGGYKSDSVWTYFYKNGKPCSMEYYSNGSILKFECFDENGKPEKCEIDSNMIKLMESDHIKSPDANNNNYTLVEKMPEADYDVNRFLGQNIRYPANARDNGIQGRVAVQFIVDEDGKITDIRPAGHSKLGTDLENEAVRVVSMMPNWKPDRMHHKPVKVYYTLPVVFRLEY